MNDLMDLRACMSNHYSQCGEDGVLAHLIEVLGLKDLWCCEFGAWDGQHASNTFHLVSTAGARAVMIEGDPVRYQDLLVTAAQWPTIQPLHARISADPGSSSHLDTLLAPTGIPRDFDILSIDIDGDDLITWESITQHTPKIVIIEINPRIEPGVFQRHSDVPFDPTPMTDLNSFSSTVAVGQAKGYDLVCHTSCNLIFARQDLRQTLGVAQRYIDNPVLLFDWKWVKKARKAARKRQHEQAKQT